MLWEDKLLEWQNQEVTQALLRDMKRAERTIEEKLVYATMDLVPTLQGLARAYKDIIEIIETLNLGEEEEEDEFDRE